LYDFEKEKNEMLKSRMMFGIVAMVMILAFSQSGYSQLQITVAAANPSPRETATNKTAETNNPLTDVGLTITGTALSTAPITGGRLRIQYPSAVTNSDAFPGGAGCTNPPSSGCDPIRVEIASGIFTNSFVTAVDNANGRVDIALPCLASPAANATGTIVVTGVRIDASAISAFPASAALSNIATGSTWVAFSSGLVASPPQNGPGCGPGLVTPANVILSTNTAEVISASAAGIGGVANGGLPSGTTNTVAAVASGTTGCNLVGGTTSAFEDCGIASVFTNRAVPKNVATFTVTEGHNSAWFNASTTQFGGAGGFVNDGGFELTFNNLPAGVTLTLGIAAHTGTTAQHMDPFFNTAGGAGIAACSGAYPNSTCTITTANNSAIVNFGADLRPDAIDRITFRVTGVTVSSGATLTAGNVSVSASMSPTGDALDSNSVAIQTTFPRFSSGASVGTTTVLTISPANTTLLIPFAVVGGNFDTGIAIANTSIDPFGGSAGGGATAQAGTVQVFLFPSTATGAGTAVNFTTSATKKAGVGIAADGTVAAGATWAVNLSELLPLAGQTGGFSGYVFITANFLPAHGQAYIYDGRGFTAAANVLVLPNPSIQGRTGSSSGAEALNF